MTERTPGQVYLFRTHQSSDDIRQQGQDTIAKVNKGAEAHSGRLHHIPRAKSKAFEMPT